MIPFDHQIQLAEDAYEILREHFIVYLACEERTGKTLAAILTAEMTSVETVLVITKKTPVQDWKDTLAAFKHKKKYTVTNYHNAHKQSRHDLVILDESHNYISGYPKPSAMWKKLRALLVDTPLIYISATPHAQGYQMLYHQFALSSWSPWARHSNFYQWFKVYGRPYTVPINGVDINQYDRTQEAKIKASTDHLFITKTRKELGFAQEPKDKLHYVELDQSTKDMYNTLIEDQIIQLPEGWLVCDTQPKLRFALHMLEGGTAKIEDQRITLPNNEKIDFILDHFGDSSSLVIMYNYIQEFTKLSKYFKKALLLQATSFAEGVDLHEYDNLVIYSQDFSTARHTQRRARQANKKRLKPIIVHYVLVKKATSEKVYRTVSIKKKNFVDKIYAGDKL